MTADQPGANPVLNSFWTRSLSEIDADVEALSAAPPQFWPEETFESGGVSVTGPGAWVVTSHAEVVAISKNPSVFSSAAGVGLLDTPPELNEYMSSLIAMDDPRHARLRSLISRGFTPRSLERLEHTIVQRTTSIIDRIAERGACDFVADIAAKLPIEIVCELMGIPDSLHDDVLRNADVILGATDPDYGGPDGDILQAILGAARNLTELMVDVSTSKRGRGLDDLTSTLVNSRPGGERLIDAEIASFFILLVVAGNETTRNALSWGLHQLTANPDQLARWQADVDALAPTAVDEIVRLASPVIMMRRTATTDTRIGDSDIAEGDKVCMHYLAANRDPSAFADPAVFDVGRTPNRHLGFGGPGPHFCLGAHLARQEIAEVFRQLLRRLPDIHATQSPTPLASSFIHGIKSLPCAYTPI